MKKKDALGPERGQAKKDMFRIISYVILLSIRTGNNQMTQADTALTERRESHDEFPVPGGGEKLQLYAEGKQ